MLEWGWLRLLLTWLLMERLMKNLLRNWMRRDLLRMGFIFYILLVADLRKALGYLRQKGF